MISTKYFCNDMLLTDGVREIANSQFSVLFPNVKGVKFDGYHKLAGYHLGHLLPVTRRVYFNSNGTRHKCSAKCLNAKGHECECSCEGKNHGLGLETVSIEFKNDSPILYRQI